VAYDDLLINPQRCPTMLSYDVVLWRCPTMLSYDVVLWCCPMMLSYDVGGCKSLLLRCLTCRPVSIICWRLWCLTAPWCSWYSHRACSGRIRAWTTHNRPLCTLQVNIQTLDHCVHCKWQRRGAAGTHTEPAVDEWEPEPCTTDHCVHCKWIKLLCILHN